MNERNRTGIFDADLDHSTETDTEFDIVHELKVSVEGIENDFYQSDKENFSEKISYLKFLLRELDDSLSGQYEELRRRRFITKKSV